MKSKCGHCSEKPRRASKGAAEFADLASRKSKQPLIIKYERPRVEGLEPIQTVGLRFVGPDVVAHHCAPDT